MNRQLTTLLLLASLLLPSASLPAAWAVGDKLPDLNTFELEGTLPQSLQGRVVLLDFWASWCAPCRMAVPTLNDFHDTFPAEDFALIGISVDDKSSAMKRFLKKTPASFTIVRDAKQGIVQSAQIETMPTSVLIDREGIIRHIHSGFKLSETPTSLKAEIEKLLAE